jgi:hypothetical protein
MTELTWQGKYDKNGNKKGSASYRVTFSDY